MDPKVRAMRTNRLSRRYKYFYNVLKTPVTFDFGVTINISDDDEEDTSPYTYVISSDDEDTIPYVDHNRRQ